MQNNSRMSNVWAMSVEASEAMVARSGVESRAHDDIIFIAE